MISYPAYQQLALNFNSSYSSSYNATVLNKGYSYNVPKQKLLVKYASNITDQRREYIINGIRSLFPPGLDQPIMVDVVSIIDSLRSVNLVFTFIVGIIGVISLILTFFLLFVATT